MFAFSHHLTSCCLRHSACMHVCMFEVFPRVFVDVSHTLMASLTLSYNRSTFSGTITERDIRRMT